MPPLPFHSFLLYHGHLLVIPYDIRDAVINRLLGSCQKRAFGKVQKTKRLSRHICPYISSPPPSCCHAGGTIVFQFQFVCTLAPPLSGGHFLSILGTFTILLRITLFFFIRTKFIRTSSRLDAQLSNIGNLFLRLNL